MLTHENMTSYFEVLCCTHSALRPTLWLIAQRLHLLLPPSSSCNVGGVSSVTSPVATGVTGSAHVTWSAAAPHNAPISSYVVHFASDASPPHTGTVTVDGVTLTEEVTGLTVTDSYSFYVYATNAATDDGPDSAVSSPATLILPAVPGVPTALQVEAASPESLSISWSAPAVAPNNVVTEYHVQVRLDADGAVFQDIATDPAVAAITGTTVVAAGLDVHASYEVRVSTVNQSGECKAMRNASTLSVCCSCVEYTPLHCKA